MNLHDFEDHVRLRWTGHPGAADNKLRDLFIMSTGLGGETGEVLEKLKKYVRDDTECRDGMLLELGDVLFYLTRIAQTFGWSLDDVMKANVAKLTNRAARNTLAGSGDER